MANIAEGFDRATRKEFVQFLRISLGSTSETKSHLYIGKELDYINQEQLDKSLRQAEIVSKQLAGFIKYLQLNPYTKKP